MLRYFHQYQAKSNSRKAHAFADCQRFLEDDKAQYGPNDDGELPHCYNIAHRSKAHGKENQQIGAERSDPDEAGDRFQMAIGVQACRALTAQHIRSEQQGRQREHSGDIDDWMDMPYSKLVNNRIAYDGDANQHGIQIRSQLLLVGASAPPQQALCQRK